MSEDLSYLTTEYARRKDIECYDIEASYDGVSRWHDPDITKSLADDINKLIEDVE